MLGAGRAEDGLESHYRPDGGLGGLARRGSTQTEALATQREKNLPHVTLINNFFFSKGKIKSSLEPL